MPSTLPRSMLDIFLPGELIFQCHIFLTFHTAYGVLMAGIPEWFAIPSFTGPCFVRILHCDPSWVALHSVAHNSTELHKPFAMTSLCSVKGVFPLHLNFWFSTPDFKLVSYISRDSPDNLVNIRFYGTGKRKSC